MQNAKSICKIYFSICIVKFFKNLEKSIDKPKNRCYNHCVSRG